MKIQYIRSYIALFIIAKTQKSQSIHQQKVIYMYIYMCNIYTYIQMQCYSNFKMNEI